MKCTWKQSLSSIHILPSSHKAHLRSRASQIRTEHDRPWCFVGELLSSSLESILEELHVATTTVAALLVLDLVLHDERLLREVDRFHKGRRDGVVRRLGLSNEALVTFDEDIFCVFDRPLADVAESLAADWGLLGRLRRRPAFRPVVAELFKERCLDACGLQTSGSVIIIWTWVNWGNWTTCLEDGLGFVGRRASGSTDEESRKRYASHVVRRAKTGSRQRVRRKE